MRDKHGREYAKLADLKVGDKIELDGDFTCQSPGIVTIQGDNNGLFFACNEGGHHLSGQLTDEGYLIGIYPVKV